MKLTRLFAISIVAAALISSNGNAAQREGAQKSVLLIYDNRSDMLGNIVVDRAIRKTLTDEFTFDLDIRSEYLEASSLTEEDFPALLSWFRRKYPEITFDIVVPVGPIALRFVRDHRNELFHGSQFVFWGRQTNLDQWETDTPITGVVAPSTDRQIVGTLAFIRALQPDIEQLIIVTGKGPLDLQWEAEARNTLGSLSSRIAVTYLTGLPLEDVLERLSHLPRKTAVFFLSIEEDGAGRQLTRTQFISKVAQVAAAPVYFTSALYIDTGVVGGALVDQETMAADAADVIGRLLRGEDIRNLPVREVPLVPMVNWKALTRWNLAPDLLPPGTVIKDKTPSVWETYRWHIIAVISLCLLETALILALLIHRANRKRAERAMMESRHLLQSTMDSLNARVALLDEKGTIIAVNRSWTTLAPSDPDGTIKGVGYNYLEANASNNGHEEARLISDGIRVLITGDQENFRYSYPFLQPSGDTWFQVRVSRFDMPGAPRLVVMYEDVTEIKQAHDAQQKVTGLLMRAQDEERRRIARDLHDSTVQNIVAIKANLAFVAKGAGSLDALAGEMLRESSSLSDQVIKELRTLSYLLHPPLLDEVGLVPALQWFVRGFIRRSGVEIELFVKDDIGRLPTEIETALFRVVQESLTNIHRHSGSRRGIIWVTKEQDAVVLRIRDEGHGFSLPTASNSLSAGLSPGVGISSMRQRLRQLGGQLEIESGADGTTVKARVSILQDRTYAHLAS